MDPDEFKARMIAAGVPDMQLFGDSPQGVDTKQDELTPFQAQSRSLPLPQAPQGIYLFILYTRSCFYIEHHNIPEWQMQLHRQVKESASLTDRSVLAANTFSGFQCSNPVLIQMKHRHRLQYGQMLKDDAAKVLLNFLFSCRQDNLERNSCITLSGGSG